MEKYLLELIKEHNRVIVPNFGAFIVSREKGQTILFNSFLSFNDGLLVNHICKIDDIDAATAIIQVEEFVKTVNLALDQQGIFEMDNLGTFTKDQTGILRFVQKEQEGFQKPETPVQKTPTRKESIDLLDIDTTGMAKTDVVDEPFKPSDSVSKEKLLIIDAAPATPPQPKPMQQKEEKRQIKQPVIQKKVTIEKTQNRKRVIPVWLVILLITLPLLLVLFYFLFFKDGIHFFKSKAPIPVEQIITNDTQKVQPEIDVKAEPEQPKPVLTTRRHHIIVGSFKDETKANELAATLKNKGLDNVSVLNHHGRFLVSADWKSNVNKALERQEELLKELNMENWVLSLR